MPQTIRFSPAVSAGEPIFQVTWQILAIYTHFLSLLHSFSFGAGRRHRALTNHIDLLLFISTIFLLGEFSRVSFQILAPFLLTLAELPFDAV